ncbi:MAG: ABC transporter ATP-binding protein [Ruminococcus sp.]
MSLLKLDNICYRYDNNSPLVINNLSYEFEEGKVYAIVGKSGAGKTTLLSILSSLAAPTSGKIYLKDEEVAKIDKYKFRSKYVGVIFQNFNLLPHLTALENVVLSMNISGKKFTDKSKNEIAMELLNKVGLSEEEANRRILKLSGGQQQRVAIARAISYNPDIILADEPTGNLDSETQSEIIDIFKMLAKEGKCIIIVTHSKFVAEQSDTVFKLSKTS